ncbi:hypothetical protein RND81_14G095600 [Saponaria officinalis]|uniref:Serpentine receptor class gamma n=1 Tax=Saponaria officinalis TaxID=3572 RepID=A0AAW1GJP7_SAPOF
MTPAIASSTAPAPSPAFAPVSYFAYSLHHTVFPTLPSVETFDIATIGLIICFVFLSLISLSFILHLRIKSRHSTKLQRFSSHWTARFLMIILILLWSLNELLRLPILRKGYLFPFLPTFSLSSQTTFCQFHLVLSFGLFEPGFLVTLLFLVNISVNKRSPSNLWAIGFVGLTCLPLFVAIYFAVFILPGKFRVLAPAVYRYSVLMEDKISGERVLYCTYPFIGTVIFAVFGVVYSLAFLVSCWKVVSLAINKRIGARVNMLALTVIVCLSVQVVLLSTSVFWDPVDAWYYVFVFINFASVLTFGAMSQGILVIKPVTDTLGVESVPRRDGRCLGDESV